ncbi:hypothetical protein BDV33DRAFT_197751 [Aspergillus novoparasiticus]|uniref:SRR1-like domain-containing protein n=1 Tax=Aspergillus novoparasiticus TaxID=986946 RepID=A0A5N6FA39_9EURO|nr:hypothetical protein BDV33DRAFT_197751 [Aspergillus novoparasiticus]
MLSYLVPNGRLTEHPHDEFSKIAYAIVLTNQSSITSNSFHYHSGFGYCLGRFFLVSPSPLKGLHPTKGKPLFTRRVLEGLSRQIDEGKEEVYIPNLDGIPRVYNLKPPYCENYQFDTYFICYQGIQSLCHIHPYSPESFLRGALTPIWLESDSQRNLEHHLVTLKTTANIRKIVCFGLGTLRRLSDDEYTRTHTQHAAVETMVASLAKRGLNVSQEIKCYAQDLEYDEADQEILRSIGITTLKDPKGFLEVDEHTLVFSVCPDIPVKQIVTDLHWPAAMIWDTVTPSEKNQTEMFPRLKKDKKEAFGNRTGPSLILTPSVSVR